MKFGYLLLATTSVLIMAPLSAVAAPANDLISKLEALGATGNGEANYHLGMAYHTGSGVSANPAKALEYFRLATEQGDPLAAYKLGCYYDGQGQGLVEDDAELALQHKLVAAEAGYTLAQQDVASLYARRGDLPAALDWLERAVAQGWPDTMLTYASIHNGAKGIEPDPVKTDAYFRLYLLNSDGNDRQRQWLKDFEGNMSEADRARAAAIVNEFVPRPTALTLKALSGVRAAEELAGQ